MRTSLKVLFLALVAITSAATLVARQHPQKPGKWQIKMEVDMPGMKMPPMTQEICMTEADLADPKKAAMSDPKSGCSVTDYKVKGNTATWKLDCPQQGMKGSGESTFAGDTMSGSVKVTASGQEINTKYTGTWLGTCSK